MLRPIFLLLASALFCVSSEAQTKSQDSTPFNHFQWLATHNSYHIAPPQKIRELIDLFSPGGGEALNYTFRPLSEQLDAGIRGLELDLYNEQTRTPLRSNLLKPARAGEIEALK